MRKKKKSVKKAVLGIGATKDPDAILDELLPEGKPTAYYPQPKNASEAEPIIPSPIQSLPISHPEQPPIKEKAPPTIKDREIALKEMELELQRDFMGKIWQNTTITADERVLLSIIADTCVFNRFPSSKQYCIENGIPWNDTEFINIPVKDYVDRYIGFGLPVEGKGRMQFIELYQRYKEAEMAAMKKQDDKRVIT